MQRSLTLGQPVKARMQCDMAAEPLTWADRARARAWTGAGAAWGLGTAA